MAFHSSHQKEAIGVAVVIDDLRNKALTIANELYGKLNKPPFPMIQTPGHYRKLASRFEAVTDILEVKPSIFGVGVDLGKMIKRLFRIR